jgi:thioredoxin
MTTANPTNEFVFDVTEVDFNEKVVELSKTVPVLIDFWAEWCGPCKSLSPILEKLAQAYGGKFYLAKVDTEKAKQLASYFQIKSIPDCRLIKNGEMVDGFTGALPEGQIRKFLDKHLVSEAEQMRLAASESENDEEKEPRRIFINQRRPRRCRSATRHLRSRRTQPKTKRPPQRPRNPSSLRQTAPHHRRRRRLDPKTRSQPQRLPRPLRMGRIPSAQRRIRSRLRTTDRSSAPRPSREPPRPRKSPQTTNRMVRRLPRSRSRQTRPSDVG